ncbi:MAG TPA: hypothetical protein VFO60_12515 [Candidatus Dormibacteraeota bacterium]|nr:hypothetical protein [Candidatus Dormibacteraeota bacterium]
MFRLTIARVALAGAGLAAAGGGIVATHLSPAPVVSATLAAAQPTPSPSSSGATTAPNRTAKPHTKTGGVRRALGLRLRHALVLATAKATGQTVEQVRDALRSGKSLDDIAGPKAAAIKTTVEQDVRTRVEKAVDAKRITQAQADKLLARLDPAVDRIMAAHRTPKPAATSPAA